MLMRLRTAGLLWASLFTLAGVVVLLGLGSWQMQRKAWKDGLVERVVARSKAAPIAVEDVAKRFATDNDIEYLRVTARGTFLHQHERFYYAPDQRLGPGYHVYTPLELGPGLGCTDYVLVNRGFVPEAFKSRDKRAAADAVPSGGVWTSEAGGTVVVGLVRLPERPGTFTPANEPKTNLWFWRDLDGMAAALAQSPQPLKRPACARGARPYPFFVDAAAEPANSGGWPKGGTTHLVIPNRHLEYALTWYGLAATLIAVFAVFARGRLLASDRPSPQ